MLYYLQGDKVKKCYFLLYRIFILYIQFMFKAAQTFVDRHQLNQRGP